MASVVLRRGGSRQRGVEPRSRASVVAFARGEQRYVFAVRQACGRMRVETVAALQRRGIAGRDPVGRSRARGARAAAETLGIPRMARRRDAGRHRSGASRN